MILIPMVCFDWLKGVRRQALGHGNKRLTPDA
jgi:hypothetical protein